MSISNILIYPTTAVIYRFLHVKSGRFYIGSAVNFRNRVKLHLRRFRAGTHHNPKLQAAWDTYGAEAFVFEILEDISNHKNLYVREQFYIDTLKPHYNIALNVTSPMLGRKQSHKFISMLHDRKGKITFTPEQRAKIAATLRGRKGRILSLEARQRISSKLKGHEVSERTRAKIGAKATGYRHTQDAKEKIRASALERDKAWMPALAGQLNPQAKLSWEKVREIRKRYSAGNTTLVQLAQEYGVDHTTIGLIVRHKTWKEDPQCFE